MIIKSACAEILMELFISDVFALQYAEDHNDQLNDAYFETGVMPVFYIFMDHTINGLHDQMPQPEKPV